MYRSDIIAINEVHAQNSHMLKMNNFSQFIKLRSKPILWVRKGVEFFSLSVMIFILQKY